MVLVGGGMTAILRGSGAHQHGHRFTFTAGCVLSYVQLFHMGAWRGFISYLIHTNTVTGHHSSQLPLVRQAQNRSQTHILIQGSCVD